MVNLQTCLRRAVHNDQNHIANLIYFEPHVHRHLDWRSPLDWLGAPEYWVLEQGNTISAVLACPPDPPGVAWIRLFGHDQNITGEQAWQTLWQYAREQGVGQEGSLAVAITMQRWFGEILENNGFSLSQKIVVLDYIPAQPPRPSKNVFIPIRPMTEKDLPKVAALDAASFLPIWQNSLCSLEMAYTQAGLATVMEDDGQLVGYQISTISPFGIHLARLAVRPSHQGRGLGMALVQDLIRHAYQQMLGRITVNTQDDNTPSLSLYNKLGFKLTGEQYPVYTFT
jgi:[ribosomal protein S18]-alanine N-acetyltransferase